MAGLWWPYARELLADKLHTIRLHTAPERQATIVTPAVSPRNQDHSEGAKPARMQNSIKTSIGNWEQ